MGLTLLAIVSYVFAMVGSDQIERTAAVRSDFRAGAGTIKINGPSSWTVRYRGPDPERALAGLHNPLVQDPLVRLEFASNIPGEAARLDPPDDAPQPREGEVNLAELRLGRGTHEVTIHFDGAAQMPGAADLAFRRWGDPNPLPLLFVGVVTVPLSIAAAAAGLVAVCWTLWIALFGSPYPSSRVS